MIKMNKTNTVQTQRLDREEKEESFQEKENLKVMNLGSWLKTCCFVEVFENRMWTIPSIILPAFMWTIGQIQMF